MQLYYLFLHGKLFARRKLFAIWSVISVIGFVALNESTLDTVHVFEADNFIFRSDIELRTSLVSHEIISLFTLHQPVTTFLLEFLFALFRLIINPAVTNPVMNHIFLATETLVCRRPSAAITSSVLYPLSLYFYNLLSIGRKLDFSTMSYSFFLDSLYSYRLVVNSSTLLSRYVLHLHVSPLSFVLSKSLLHFGVIRGKCLSDERASGNILQTTFAYTTTR